MLFVATCAYKGMKAFTVHTSMEEIGEQFWVYANKLIFQVTLLAS
jgi:hypothetical protein